MTESTEQDKHLSDQQRQVKTRLQNRVLAQLEMLGKISSQRNRDPRDWSLVKASDSYAALKTPRQPNCLGVFGGRGSGKTTVLVALAQSLAKEKHNWKIIQRPMDLSYAPREFPHGLTIVHWLNEMVLAAHGEGQQCIATKTAFEQVSRSYFRGADGFNQLVRDLAVSPEHYAASAASEIRLRLNLWRQIQAWLDALCEALGVEGIVVPVDDADLTPANRHQSLVWSLLDELHQDRLVLILAGDLTRLEKRLAGEESVASGMEKYRDEDREASIRLAREIVYKVIPPVGRGELDPWPPSQRLKFTSESTEESKFVPLRDVIGAFGIDPIIRRHLGWLLPEWPRGLENIYRELEILSDSSKPSSNSDAEIETTADENAELSSDEFLEILANGSSRTELVKKLRQRPAEQWALGFTWSNGGSTLNSTWEQIRRRLNDDEIPYLLPDPAMTPLPLDFETVRWAEVLLDLSMQHELVSPLRLVSRIPWLEARLSHCHADLERTEESLDRSVEDEPGVVLAALYWLRWSEPGRASPGRFSIGFWHVIEWLLGDRLLWPDEMRQETWSPLALAREAGMSNSPNGSNGGHGDFWINLAKGSKADGSVVPARTRELLGLVDKLASQPWSSLQRVDSRVGPGGLARLAAALCVRAYLECLELSLELAEGDRKFAEFSSGLRSEGALLELTGPLGGVGGHTIHELDEMRIRELFRRVEAAGRNDLKLLRKFDKVSPLATALINLLEAPWFTGLAH